MIVSEFKNLNELNDYLQRTKFRADVIPVERNFDNPNTKLRTSCITYVLIEYSIGN